jgi:alpha-galactosidase
MNLDDCYSEKTRNANGDIVARASLPPSSSLSAPCPRPSAALTHIQSDKTRFSSGMNHLTDQIHAFGMKAGIVRPISLFLPTSPPFTHTHAYIHIRQYSDSGWFTCQLYPGSYLNEARSVHPFFRYEGCLLGWWCRDVKLFRDWGFDYLKYASPPTLLCFRVWALC